MSKTKTPFFSFSSSGTVASELTTQRTRGQTIVRRRPVPTDRLTLPQQYQRWDYTDQAYRWRFLSDADKLSYEQLARPLHMTGFAYWMRTRLNTLPDISARFRGDILFAGSTPDSSKSDNPGSVIGATLVHGHINNGLSFDGIDDICEFPDDPLFYLLNEDQDFTIMLRLKLLTLSGGWDNLYGNDGACQLAISPARLFRFYIWYGAGDAVDIYSNAAQPLKTWLLLTMTRDSSNDVRMYIGDTLQADTDNDGRPPAGSNRVRYLGGLPGYPFCNMISDLFLLSPRCFDLTEIRRHSERRYP